jgi:hypothetical protein
MSVTYQISDKRGDAILVVKVEEPTVEQAEAAFAAAVGLAGLGTAYESFGIPNPVAAVPAAALATRPAQDPWGQPPVPPMVPAAATPQYQQPAPAGAPGAAPVCQHGAKLYRSGTAQATGREWKAWFCPASSSDSTQCPKEWIR